MSFLALVMTIWTNCRRQCMSLALSMPCSRLVSHFIPFVLHYSWPSNQTHPIGALHMSEIPSHNALAQQYITLSEACLKIDDYLTNTNVTVIDTLLLHITYYYTTDEPSDNSPGFTRTGPYPSSAARAWVILGVAMRLAIAIGLHRDPSLWGLPAKEVSRRRRTMVRTVPLERPNLTCCSGNLSLLICGHLSLLDGPRCLQDNISMLSYLSRLQRYRIPSQVST